MHLYLFCNKSHYENVPFEIPESWCWCTLSELCIFLSRGKSPKYSEERLFPVFAQKCNLKDGGISLDQARFLDPSTIEKWGDDYKLKSGDVLVNSTGTGTVGRTRLFDECCLGEYPFVVPDSHVSVVRTATEIDSFYIWAILSSNWGQQYIEDNLAGSTNQKELYIGVLEDMFIPLPPKNEQKKIAKEIARWGKYVDNIDVVKAELSNYVKQTKSKILDLAISGKLVPQDPNDEPAIELLKRINPGFKPCDNSHYGNLPQGWTIVGLHSVAEIITGSTPSKLNAEYYNGDVPFYKPNDLDQGRHVRCASEYLSQQGKSISRSIPCNSIAVCCIGSIGKCGFIEKEGVTNQQINTIVPNDAIFPLYMYYFCNSSTFIDELKSLSSAVTISIVNKSKLSTIQIPLPPIAEQKRIISVIEKLYSHLDMITAEL